ncbi:MAG: hypothetical protein FJY95_15670 [Candidatus Handelsmanbacteria bacterium]|nr:hypothetical protein [Candidatus Handelsmanbacteria bacterium]
MILLRAAWRRPFTIEVARSGDSGRMWSVYERIGELEHGAGADPVQKRS